MIQHKTGHQIHQMQNEFETHLKIIFGALEVLTLNKQEIMELNNEIIFLNS